MKIKPFIIFLVLMWIGMWFGGFIADLLPDIPGAEWLMGVISFAVIMVPGYFLWRRYGKKFE